MPGILPTHTPDLFQQAVDQTARALTNGQIAAVPTETVYGLAANATNPDAVRAIFKLKQRPPTNPLIVHVADLEMAKSCVAHWPDIANDLAQAFWPGPLTLVLPRSEIIPDIVTAGGPTVGIRWPSHPFIQAVIRSCGFPLAAPSANRSTELSPTNPNHVLRAFSGEIPLIVDGGQCQVGIESTVLDLTCEVPTVLRPGIIGTLSLNAVVGSVAVKSHGHEPEVLKSPGMMARHYAPRATVRIGHWANDAGLTKAIEKLGWIAAETDVIAHSNIPSGAGFNRVVVIPHDPEAFARALYAELHACDEAGAKKILMEAVPQGDDWDAVRDRLKRAATDPQ